MSNSRASGLPLGASRAGMRKDRMTQFFPAPTRRHALLAMASVPLIAAPTIARAQTVPVKVGFVPVIGAASLFVLEQTGWARDAGLALTTTKFD